MIKLASLGLCLAILGAPAVRAAPPDDVDVDLVANAADDCPTAWDPDQEDTGGIGALSGPDGVGDVCQCGDIDFDLRTTGIDVELYRLHLAESPGAALGPAARLRCDVAGAGAACDIQDVAVLRRALAPSALGPGIASLCPGGATDPGVFVATSGSDASLGTAVAPLATVAAGLAVAQVFGSTQLWVGSGDYAGPRLDLVSGVSITGGFDPANWQPSVLQTHYWATSPVAAQATGLIAPTKLERIRLAAANATAPGGSSYALLASSSPGLAIVRSALIAGAGAGAPATANGGSGTNGSSGGIGNPGCEDSTFLCSSCSQPSGGLSGLSACGRTGGTGGQPGHGGGTGVTGGTGVGGTLGGAGGPSGANGTVGSPGTPGSVGAGGPGASTFLSAAPSGLFGEAGGPGGSGSPGNGGGGGGGGGGGTTDCDSYGSSGGGGGAGGCGGSGGPGGSGGGGSIALYLFGSSAVVSETALETGPASGGGAGGLGGLGGSGGAGGPGGLYGGGSEQDDGGNGAAGGSGGAGALGGFGGGGAGGPSIGIGCGGGSSLPLDFDNIFSLGAAGAGGVSQGNAGSGGVHVDRFGC